MFHFRGLPPAALMFALLLCLTAVSDASPVRVASCASAKHDHSFLLTSQGLLNLTLGTVQGPVCFQIALDTVRFDALVTTNESTAAGKDLSSFLISGISPSAGGGRGPVDTFDDIYNDFQIQLRNVNAATTALKTLISNIDVTLASNGDPEQTLTAASAYYTASVLPSLSKLQDASRKLYATDLPSGSLCSTGMSLGAPLPGSLEFRLAGIKVTQTALVAADQTDLDTKNAKLKTDPPTSQASDQTAVEAAQAKLNSDTVDLNKANGYIAFADAYKCNSATFVALTKQLQALAYWMNRLGDIGFTEPPTGGTSTLLPAPGKIASGLSKTFFVQAYRVSCPNRLNVVTTDALSLSTSDQLPTIDGNAATLIPSSGAPPVFITVSCASPVSLSAGLEVSGIRDQEYAVVQSKDPAGGATPISLFSYTHDSPYHLLPIALAHFRIKESDNLRYGLHASVGISGNLQGTASGGSTAEYLFGGSFAFLRIFYLTAGAHLGYKSVLGGGYSVGDIAPSTITTPQVNKTATVRYGFALTFSKP